jgi:hypothetical protein
MSLIGTKRTWITERVECGSRFVITLSDLALGRHGAPEVERLSQEELSKSLFVALGVLALVIAVRIAWMLVYRLVLGAVWRRSPQFAHRLGARSPRGAVVPRSSV